MKHLLYILALLMVGCSGNNLVHECGGNMVEAASTIEVSNQLMLSLIKNSVVKKPSRTLYLTRLQSLDSIYKDSISQTESCYNKALLILNKKNSFDSVVYGYTMMYCLPFFPFFEMEYADSILAIYPKVNEYIDSLAINANNPSFTIIPIINDSNKKVRYYHYCINYTKGWGYKLSDITHKKMKVNSKKAAPNWKVHYDYTQDLYYYKK